MLDQEIDHTISERPHFLRRHAACAPPIPLPQSASRAPESFLSPFGWTVTKIEQTWKAFAGKRGQPKSSTVAAWVGVT